MTTIRQALRQAAARLENAGVPDAMHDAALLLSHLLGEPPLNLRADAGRPLPEGAETDYEALIHRRETREPLQYITGQAWFMGLPLQTAPGVLIPRFDTEALCQRALARVPSKGRVLDLCTGSGALAVAIAHARPGARMLAGDISPEALALTRRNAAACGAAVEARQGDLFAPFAGEAFDAIVSNPPYIPAGELPTLQAEVRREPALALDGGADGLDFYRRIAAEAPAFLSHGGWLLLEIGSSQAAAVTALLRDDFEEIAVYQDLNGLDRVVEGRKRT